MPLTCRGLFNSIGQLPLLPHRNIAGRSSSHSRHYDLTLQEQVKPPRTRLIALRAGALFNSFARRTGNPSLWQCTENLPFLTENLPFLYVMPTCLQTSTHGIAEIMATYSREDFEEIASAIDKDIADVCQQEKHFEAAAMWYRLDRKAPKRQTPFVIQRRMRQIVNAARRLLKYLQVEDQSQASDGPGIAILHVLASTDDGTEDAVVRATARIGRLVEILEAVDAARELERRASMGAEDAVQIGELVVPKGHHGQVAVNDWIAAMMSIYQKITGTDPGISVVAPGRPGRGKAAGPLIRFLQAAGKPIGIESSADSLAGRIKDVRTGGRRRKK